MFHFRAFLLAVAVYLFSHPGTSFTTPSAHVPCNLTGEGKEIDCTSYATLNKSGVEFVLMNLPAQLELDNSTDLVVMALELSLHHHHPHSVAFGATAQFGFSNFTILPRVSRTKCQMKLICGRQQDKSFELPGIVKILASSSTEQPIHVTAHVGWYPVHLYQPGDNISFNPGSTGLRGGASWLQMLEIPRSADLSGQAHLSLTSEASASDEDMGPRSTKVYLMPYQVQQTRSCTSLSELLEEVHSGKGEFLSFKITKAGTLPWSTASTPQLAPGKWLVMLRPPGLASHFEWDMRISGKLSLSPNRAWVVVLAALLIAVLLPLSFVILSTGAVHGMVHCLRFFMPDGNQSLIRQHTEIHVSFKQLGREWCLIDPDFRSFLKQYWSEKFEKGYMMVLIIATASFFTAALQYAWAIWRQTQISGNRDICRYNNVCFIALGWDLPINSIVSHIPYFICGFLSLGRVVHAEFHLGKLGLAAFPDESMCPNLCVFKGLAITMILEGCGSLTYHICPNDVSFQFDCAVMFVIALLSSVALLGTNRSLPLNVLKVLPPFGLLLVLVIPMWFLNSVNTSFDMGMRAEGPYSSSIQFTSTHFILYGVVASIWGVIVMWYARRLFPIGTSGRRPRTLWLLRLVVGIGLLFIVFPRLRFVTLKLTVSDVMIGCSVFAMLIMIVYQIFHCEDRSLANNKCDLRWPLTCSESMLLGINTIVWMAACNFFLHKTYSTSGTPEQSRLLNSPCIFLGIFDNHDVWHMLSAAGLALWIYTLLEIRLRIAHNTAQGSLVEH